MSVKSADRPGVTGAVLLFGPRGVGLPGLASVSTSHRDRGSGARAPARLPVASPVGQQSRPAREEHLGFDTANAV